MPTTLLHGETWEQARARRFREEAAIDQQILDAYELCDQQSQYTNPADDRLKSGEGHERH